ncbi:hypothetical protein, partial [Pseudolactococcus laudensis]|uniref:hypothetical protein n=1 Tax=Pseudolactococcus laudensis TaxID=1494461 RepID=UPI003F9C01DD
MTNTTTTTTTEELAMRTMIVELKIMNLKLDILEQEIDDRKKEMYEFEKKIDGKLQVQVSHPDKPVSA